MTNHPTRAEGGAVEAAAAAVYAEWERWYDIVDWRQDSATKRFDAALDAYTEAIRAEERKPRKPSLSVAAAIEAAKAVVMEYGAYQAQWANGDVPQNGEYAAAIGPTLQAIARIAAEVHCKEHEAGACVNTPGATPSR
jgi:hypothetical protein